MDYGVTIMPDKDVNRNEWLNKLSNSMKVHSVHTVEILTWLGNTKFLLSGDYDGIKALLDDMYGYIDYSSIYLWDAKTYGLLNLWKTRPRGDYELWELI